MSSCTWFTHSPESRRKPHGGLHTANSGLSVMLQLPISATPLVKCYTAFHACRRCCLLRKFQCSRTTVKATQTRPTTAVLHTFRHTYPKAGVNPMGDYTLPTAGRPSSQTANPCTRPGEMLYSSPRLPPLPPVAQVSVLPHGSHFQEGGRQHLPMLQCLRIVLPWLLVQFASTAVAGSRASGRMARGWHL